MGEPRRIQLRRTKGWRKPEGAVVVSRPSRWGNPYRVERYTTARWNVIDDRRGEIVARCSNKVDAATQAVALYLAFVVEHRVDLSPLAGRDLCCWCGPSDPCHADVLLELANPAPS